VQESSETKVVKASPWDTSQFKTARGEQRMVWARSTLVKTGMFMDGSGISVTYIHDVDAIERAAILHVGSLPAGTVALLVLASVSLPAQRDVDLQRRSLTGSSIHSHAP
jgi:hypothetical protein